MLHNHNQDIFLLYEYKHTLKDCSYSFVWDLFLRLLLNYK